MRFANKINELKGLSLFLTKHDRELDTTIPVGIENKG